jgi:glycosyltransferase involved in cell wall biosynthesis
MSMVSVIVPCYNYAHFLRECVESVLSQADVDVRMLIIDDSSTDNTSEVAAELVAHNPCVEYRRHEKNWGHIATYNDGLAWASGDYTALLSADDMLTPGALMRATQLMDAHPEVGFVYGGWTAFNNGQPVPQPRIPSASGTWEIYNGLDWLERACEAGHPHIVSPEVVVRTGLQHKLGGYRPELPLAGDLEMWMRFAVHAKVGCIVDADQAFYRVHSSNMHKRQYSAFHKDVQQRIAAFDIIFQDYRDLIPEWERLRKMANRSLACDAVWAVGQAYFYRRAAQSPISELIKFATTSYGGRLFDREHLGVYFCASRRILRTAIIKMGFGFGRRSFT